MNRYGRHGTRAWLRRYLRRREQQQREASTALVVAKPFIPIVVFNITIPAGVGKVIIIVTDEQGQQSRAVNMTNGKGVPQFVDADQDNLGIRAIKTAAGHQEMEFMYRVRGVYNDACVYIPERKEIRKIITDRAYHALNGFSSEHGINGAEFISRFTEEFLRLLEEERQKELHPGSLLTEEQWNICVFAETHPIDQNLEERYKRDVSVLSAVNYLKINHFYALSDEEKQRAHKWADTYEFFLHQKGVVWEESDFRQ